MYCRKCYLDLNEVSEARCPRCGRVFDPASPDTYLDKPFPSRMTIVNQVIATTIVAIVAAIVVAFHQIARTSSH
jgi:hypothetical protein